MSKTVAIIQARMASTRLPGKVMKMIDDQPMLDHVVRRVQSASLVDQTVVATSNQESDRTLIEHCQDRGWDFVCGHPTDVLQRYVSAAKFFEAEQIVRITSDCPLMDPNVIDRVVQVANSYPQFDLVSNVAHRRTFPRGLDVEVFSRAALQRAHEQANLDRYREHVTLAMYDQSEHFSVGAVSSPLDLSNHRWTVDTADDLLLVNRIYSYFRSPMFGMREVVDAFRLHPEWSAINSHVQQKAA